VEWLQGRPAAYPIKRSTRVRSCLYPQALGLRGTNTLAYLAHLSISVVKGFIPLDLANKNNKNVTASRWR